MEFCSMLRGTMDGRGVWGRMETCICLAESLSCSLEIIATLLIDYTLILFLKIKRFLKHECDTATLSNLCTAYDCSLTRASRWCGGKESISNAGDAGDLGSIPGSGRSPGGGNGDSLQFLAWIIPWIEEPGRLQSMGSQRVRHDWAIEHTGTLCY